MFNLKLDYREFLNRLVISILEQESTEILLVPHTFAPPSSVESDPDACTQVRCSAAPNLQGRIHLVSREYDQSEIKCIIGLCEFFIGSRMHSCIAALSQEIPTIGVAYSKKFKGVFESIGVGDWVVDGRSVDAGTAVEKVRASLNKKDEMRLKIAGRPAKARAALQETFSQLAEKSRHFTAASL
jgi:polysaccharide pyruvyl transferase WcaK-like protein